MSQHNNLNQDSRVLTTRGSSLARLALIAGLSLSAGISFAATVSVPSTAKPSSSMAESRAVLSSSNQSANPFTAFDSQIAVGNNWTFGDIGGSVYQNNNVGLNVSKLFANNLYVSVGGDQAYNSTYTNYSASNLAAQVGYAFLIEPELQVIPYGQITRSQLSNFDSSSNLDDIWYTGMAGVRLEYLPIRALKFAVNGAYGLVGQNGTLNQSSGTTVYGGSLNVGAGLSYQPLTNVPWLLNADYAYNSYAGGLISQTNQITLSTGYGF